MNDPDSAQFDESDTRVFALKDGGSRLTLKLRARNGFGAMRIMYVRCDGHKNGQMWDIGKLQQLR